MFAEASEAVGGEATGGEATGDMSATAVDGAGDGAVTDDDKPAPGTVPAGAFGGIGSSEAKGFLMRKHQTETGGKKASNRSWNQVYSVVNGQALSFYKDAKHKLKDLNLSGGNVEFAADYTKKKHVFRLKLVEGSEFLFHTKDEEDFRYWMDHLTLAIEGASESGKEQKRAHTLPADSTSPGAKKQKGKGLFTFKRK